MKRTTAPTAAKPSEIKELAEKCGIPEHQIARAMRREAVPPAVADAIARELKIPAAAFNTDQPGANAGQTAEPPPIACQLTPAEINAMLETILANRGGGYAPIIVINCGSNYGAVCGVNHGNAAHTIHDHHDEDNTQNVTASNNARADIIGAHNTAEGGGRLQSDDTTIPSAQIAGANSTQLQNK